MRTCAVLLCVLVAYGAAIRVPMKGSNLESDICSNSMLHSAHSSVKSQAWDDLRKNPCAADFQDQVDALEQGLEDPEDVREWLGEPETVELGLTQTSCGNMLPRLLYIGQGHSGSTTLSEQLNAHPQISYGKRKEHGFPFEKYKDGGKSSYVGQFSVGCNINFTFDGTIGAIFHSRAPGYMENLVKVVDPKVTKILLMFRDPTKYLNSLSFNYGEKVMHSKLSHNNECYADDIERWLKFFPKENFLFEQSEDYFHDTQSTLDRIIAFMGASPHQYSRGQLSNKAGRRRSGAKGFDGKELDTYVRSARAQECARKFENVVGQVIPNFKVNWPWYRNQTDSDRPLIKYD